MSIARHLKRNADFSQPLEEMLFTKLCTADQYERQLTVSLKPYDLTPCQYDILTVLHDAGGRLPTGETASDWSIDYG